MSEPVLHDVTTHPCKNCAGAREVSEMEWRTPDFWVTCVGCGQMVGGETMVAAVEAWDAANPMRDVSAEETQAINVELLRSRLTPSVLATMEAAQAVFTQSGEAQDLSTFLAWCQEHAIQ